MKNNPGCRGFTYLTALMVVVVMGIMLGIVGQSWKTVMQREKEEELIFRGLQYKQAFTAWYSSSHKAVSPSTLEDLLKDPNKIETKRYLRRIYKDPMTRDPNTGAPADFKLLKDPMRGGGVIGVCSNSNELPFKMVDKYSDDLNKIIAGKSKYSEWLFGYKTESISTLDVTTGAPFPTVPAVPNP